MRWLQSIFSNPLVCFVFCSMLRADRYCGVSHYLYGVVHMSARATTGQTGVGRRGEGLLSRWAGRSRLTAFSCLCSRSAHVRYPPSPHSGKGESGLVPPFRLGSRGCVAPRLVPFRVLRGTRCSLWWRVAHVYSSLATPPDSPTYTTERGEVG